MMYDYFYDPKRFWFALHETPNRIGLYWTSRLGWSPAHFSKVVRYLHQYPIEPDYKLITGDGDGAASRGYSLAKVGSVAHIDFIYRVQKMVDARQQTLHWIRTR